MKARKLTKRQRVLLKAHKYVLFERSYRQAMERINLLRSECRNNINLHKSSMTRLHRLKDFICEALPAELYEAGLVDKKISFLSLHSKKYKHLTSIKVSI